MSRRPLRASASRATRATARWAIGSWLCVACWSARAEVLLTSQWQSMIEELLSSIAALSDYRAGQAPPPVYQLPQARLEAKVCDAPCNVSAAYLPSRGIYLAAHLDPERSLEDRAALLHELVHYLQHGHPKFADLSECARDRAKEEEAYAIHNAYLTARGSRTRVHFFAGDFRCDDNP